MGIRTSISKETLKSLVISQGRGSLDSIPRLSTHPLASGSGLVSIKLLPHLPIIFPKKIVTCFFHFYPFSTGQMRKRELVALS